MKGQREEHDHAPRAIDRDARNTAYKRLALGASLTEAATAIDETPERLDLALWRHLGGSYRGWKSTPRDVGPPNKRPAVLG